MKKLTLVKIENNVAIINFNGTNGTLTLFTNIDAAKQNVSKNQKHTIYSNNIDTIVKIKYDCLKIELNLIEKQMLNNFVNENAESLLLKNEKYDLCFVFEYKNKQYFYRFGCNRKYQLDDSKCNSLDKYSDGCQQCLTFALIQRAKSLNENTNTQLTLNI
ncbi:hypothetical protein [Clostridium botulinum]|uniref:hypothetical protein n=1 Tax=Clostridium botulinum TaxID=1491 RepID=UPI0003659131|nr:hypothetical protein [Clostridium botulinum]